MLPLRQIGLVSILMSFAWVYFGWDGSILGLGYPWTYYGFLGLGAIGVIFCAASLFIKKQSQSSVGEKGVLLFRIVRYIGLGGMLLSVGVPAYWWAASAYEAPIIKGMTAGILGPIVIVAFLISFFVYFLGRKW